MLSASAISQLQQWLNEHQFDAFFIPHEDEYLGEYTGDDQARLAWATGFTGSAGVAILAADGMHLFVDGRYTLQAQAQSPACHQHHLIETPPLTWLSEHLAQGRIAIDPRLHSANWLEQAQKLSQFEWQSLAQNPIDQLWHDRPAANLSAVECFAERYTGQSSLSKRQQIGAQLQQSKLDAVLLTQADSIAWLLNIRGRDIPCVPVALSHALINRAGEVSWFIDPSRLPEDWQQHVGEGVQCFAPEQLAEQLAQLSGQVIGFDPQQSNAWCQQHLQAAGAQLVDYGDPCVLPKACKNEVELTGMRDCHVRDGVAMVKFLHQLDRQVADGVELNEALLSDQLWQIRQLDNSCLEPSFDTISAAGSNAAMCHYNHNNSDQPATLQQGEVYLVDSGAQYIDGTTDITRTVAIGECDAQVKRAFTLVLKGHIAIATARFPQGLTGAQLDPLARQFLWANGMDFDHGTGHGVGHRLGVHEGPQRISKAGTAELKAGMVISNEPGYYRSNGFGIRIENLEVVVPVHVDGDRPTLGFSSLTRAPIDSRLIARELMTDAEIAWLNDYHKTVWHTLSPLLDDAADRDWLAQATQAI
ncbi:hypothetical protein VST7929_00069 [Vibrio stylophorae]|uniref:X-Pro aminopeptidase n=1 Tax=Vibrio stylophorae TaxID=659351 RepID=A0ABM8ZPP8_9VIBR|nr:aminopeptidase P family protein [Vibrio stylophorae]CAH0532257.1 hypothetical protein VST7929_00069 [Vibrio stylophorae]